MELWIQLLVDSIMSDTLFCRSSVRNYLVPKHDSICYKNLTVVDIQKNIGAQDLAWSIVVTVVYTQNRACGLNVELPYQITY